MVGGGVALATPPSLPQRVSVPVVAVAVPRAPEPLSVSLRTADGHLEQVTPAVEPAHGIPLDPEKRCPKFEDAFRKYGLKPVATFSYIAYRESRCRIKAINIIYGKNGKVVWALNKNGTFDSGLMQINSGHRQIVRKICGGGLDKLMLLDCNLRVAKYLLNHGGLQHWGFG